MVVPVVTFNNGKTCPILGLGTWKKLPVKSRLIAKYNTGASTAAPSNVAEQKLPVKSKLIAKYNTGASTAAPSNVAERIECTLPKISRTYEMEENTSDQELSNLRELLKKNKMLAATRGRKH